MADHQSEKDLDLAKVDVIEAEIVEPEPIHMQRVNRIREALHFAQREIHRAMAEDIQRVIDEVSR